MLNTGPFASRTGCLALESGSCCRGLRGTRIYSLEERQTSFGYARPAASRSVSTAAYTLRSSIRVSAYTPRTRLQSKRARRNRTAADLNSTAQTMCAIEPRRIILLMTPSVCAFGLEMLPTRSFSNSGRAGDFKSKARDFGPPPATIWYR